MLRENAHNYIKPKPPRLRPLARPSELIVLLLILSLLTGLYYHRPRKVQRAQRAVVYREDQILLTIDLQDPASPGSYEIQEEPGFLIEVDKDASVRVQSSPCPDKLCVRRGWLQHPGEQAICLPLKILVKLEGSNEDPGGEIFDVVLGDGAYDPYHDESSEESAGSPQPEESHDVR